MAASAVRVFITLECRQERRFISRKQSYWNKEGGIPFLRFFPEKRCPRRFMVDGDINLPEKSGVVTAELTFKLCTNSFGSEDSWRITLTDYIDNTDFILDWYRVPSWVICAKKVMSQVKVLKAQMTPDLQILFMIAIDVMSHICPSLLLFRSRGL